MPQLTLLVLYVTDLKRSHRFYSDLGLTLFEERHGDGPVHYSALIGPDTVSSSTRAATDHRHAPASASPCRTSAAPPRWSAPHAIRSYRTTG